MTREQARKWFQSHMTSDPMVNEAFNVAIEALSEPSGDLISRADAIEAVCDKCPISFKDKCEWKDNGHCSMKVSLEALPSADAVHGEWIFNPTDAIDLMFAKPKCSKCGFESSDGGNFCSNCGAVMKTE